jgi:23S rRNA (adenine2503-C2)-methyltransferase
MIKGMNAHVNLIAANESRPGFGAPRRQVVLDFENELKGLGINATLRKSYGREIEAACGQLKSRALKR